MANDLKYYIVFYETGVDSRIEITDVQEFNEEEEEKYREHLKRALCHQDQLKYGEGRNWRYFKGFTKLS